MNLDFTPEELRRFIDQTADIIEEIYTEKLTRRVFAGMSPDQVLQPFDEDLPNEGLYLSEVLEKVRTDVVGGATMNIGPRYFGYITGGGNQAAIMAEMVSAALNQNNLKWHSSPISTEMEKLVIRWVSQFIGYPKTAAGAILDGGSTANFNCLAVARKNMAPESMSDKGLYGLKPMTIYVSEEGHSSFDKAVDMLGIGKKYLRKIPVDSSFRIRTDLLKKAIIEDREAGLNPICVIGIAGTTNTGAVDDLVKIEEIAKGERLWYHVDAAYGGPAAALASTASLFQGIEKADSVVINPHKWLYVPFEAACILVKEPENLRKTFSHLPDYLIGEDTGEERTDLMEYQLPLTKSFKSLKVWMTLKTFGKKRIVEMIGQDIDKARHLASMVESAPGFELMAPAPLSIVCFRYKPAGASEDEAERLNKRIIAAIEQDGRIFLTGTRIDGKTVMRVCFINPRTTLRDVELIIEVVTDLAGDISVSKEA
ncbi:MAG: hypothetical protein JJU46_07505 [Balneolaceae bacterium]|nr:hypothetical protein [Balneolaceae bacterium]MCH8547669.1 hypothetical protein [Balneolaceae bacterium]